MCTVQKNQRKPFPGTSAAWIAQGTRFRRFTLYAHRCWFHWTSRSVHIRHGLFTCALTRVVHLELTKWLSAEAFVLAFCWFTSRKGLPATVLSDNAKTFKSASKNIVKIVRAKEVIQYMSNNGVTVKWALKKVIGWSCLNFEELRSLLVEVESIVNARPLTYVYALHWHPHIWSMVDAFSLHPTPANSKLLALTNPWLDDRGTRNICCTNSPKRGERIIWSVYASHMLQANYDWWRGFTPEW